MRKINSIKTITIYAAFLFCMLPIMGNAQFFASAADDSGGKPEAIAADRLKQWAANYSHLGNIAIEKFEVVRSKQELHIYFSPAITHIPLRPSNVRFLEMLIGEALNEQYPDYQIMMYARDKNLYDFIPNYYRSSGPDASRIRQKQNIKPLRNSIRQEFYTEGLSANHIALWHSHGLYFDQKTDRWQWQRARLFGTIEDLMPIDYVLKFIAPMLENAGAYVFIPRERDTQTHEVIVDISQSAEGSELQIHNGKKEQWSIKEGGFAWQEKYIEGENPFTIGQYLSIQKDEEAYISYIPNIPEAGYYAVHVSWARHENASDEVQYTLQYAGGSVDFHLNQQMAYGTWVYLGTYFFNEGKDSTKGSLTVKGSSKGTVTTDAVRFGGGMGNIARSQSTLISDPQVSGMPRYVEGSRYYLQYAGMPADLVYSLNEGTNDYNDDFMSRGEWVNYLMGAPSGPEKDRRHPGLGVPIDLSVSFHTDAGITHNDSVIGTLAIYSAQRDKGVFPDGVSRLASRDLADLVQTQIVEDIRNTMNPQWTRRGLWDRQYSEAWRANVPSVLLELLSHQNLADMQYALDPHFQFITARAIYKGIVRFIGQQENREVVIQPLPPTRFAIKRTGKDKIRLSWQAQHDPLEPSAHPTHYKVYTRKNQEGFGQGVITQNPFLELTLDKPGELYSFKVSAINSGGESFPSEILSASLRFEEAKSILLVNGFTRFNAPPMFDSEQMGGILHAEESAIPYNSSYVYTGRQYDFRRNSPWLDDDSPGWGASHADNETRAVFGNSMNYPEIYGKQLAKMQRSFVSTSRAAFEQEAPDAHSHIIYIAGKQRRSPYSLQSNDFSVFNDNTIRRLKNFLDKGGNLIISGMHLGTDPTEAADSTALDFAEKYLGWTWRSNNADKKGNIILHRATGVDLPKTLNYNTIPDAGIYAVDAPDALEPSGPRSTIAYRYQSNHTNAAIIYNHNHKVFSAGFPLESLKSEEELHALLKEILHFFENSKK